MSDNEWNEIYEKAIKLWKTLGYSKDIESQFQTDRSPMHPDMFFQLSNVSGFNKANGNTYEEYITNWQKIYNKNIL